MRQLPDDLLARARAAVVAAQAGCGEAARLHIAARVRREGLVAVCAWCGRARGTRGAWWDTPPGSVTDDTTTTTICDACAEALVSAGLSVRPAPPLAC